jgi:molecular chaperone GrpE
MPDGSKKSSVTTDIPTDAVEEALRAVEKRAEARATPAPEAGGQAVPAEELAAENESLKAQLELSQGKARETLEKLKEEHDRFLRAAADLENYRKRAQREREEVQKYGNERLLKDIIPVLDNLERALGAAAKDDPLSGGVRLVLRQLEETLGRHGVKGFSALGQPFDPSLHEALMNVPTSERSPGTVVLEHGRGFLLNDRLVRPALVGVAVAEGAGPAPSPEAAEGGAGPEGGEPDPEGGE